MFGDLEQNCNVRDAMREAGSADSNPPVLAVR
jgi:hypothetical protein